MYCALEAYVTNNGTTIPSPVDLDAWRSNPPYQLNGCVRVSRVYTDAETAQMRVSQVMTESMMQQQQNNVGRIPPDGQVRAIMFHGVCI